MDWHKPISRVSCQKGPTRHAYAWQIGPFWQDTLDLTYIVQDYFSDLRPLLLTWFNFNPSMDK